jgi:hypothetical protein
VETIEEFAKANAPKDPWLQARLEEARRFKVLDAITQIDFQDPSDGPVLADQDPSDDEYGLRDFSPPTVARRRHAGYELARKKLQPLFVNHGLAPAPADAAPPLSPRT